MSDYDPGPPMAYPYILDDDHDPVSFTAADRTSILYQHANALMNAKTDDRMLRGDLSRADLSLMSLSALASRYDQPSLADWDRAFVVAMERLAQLRSTAGIHADAVARHRGRWADALALTNAKIVVGGDQVPANPKLVALARTCWPRYDHHTADQDPAEAENSVCAGCAGRVDSP